jgi:hypothetical protein
LESLQASLGQQHQEVASALTALAGMIEEKQQFFMTTSIILFLWHLKSLFFVC